MLSKVSEVFTKEYREETEYRELALQKLDFVKLKNQSESVDEKVQRLEMEGYVSDFQMIVGEY